LALGVDWRAPALTKLFAGGPAMLSPTGHDPAGGRLATNKKWEQGTDGRNQGNS
jgi:hypothetical protein